MSKAATHTEIIAAAVDIAAEHGKTAPIEVIEATAQRLAPDADADELDYIETDLDDLVAFYAEFNEAKI